MGTPMRARLMKSTLAQKVTKLFSTLLPLLLASLVFFHSQNGQTQRTHPTVKPSSETACKRDDLWCGVDITALKPGPSGTGNKPYASLAKRLNSQEVVSSDESESAVSLYHKGFPSKQAAVDLFRTSMALTGSPYGQHYQESCQHCHLWDLQGCTPTPACSGL
jgi:hypothetical protein